MDMWSINDEVLRKTLSEARRVVVVTGAGMSAASGIPTFRDALTGLWEKYDPTELATPEAFERQPDVVTRWYDERRVQIMKCEPNAGHLALAALEQYFEAKAGQDATRGAGGDDADDAWLKVFTQNVDQLHQRAGQRAVQEFHGNLFEWYCLRCGHITRMDQPVLLETYPPLCDRCTPDQDDVVADGYDDLPPAILRPKVVWFGEMLPMNVLADAEHSLAEADLFVSVGTSGTVYPVAGLVEQARTMGVKSVEINPQATPISDVFDWCIRAEAAEALVDWQKLVEQNRS